MDISIILLITIFLLFLLVFFSDLFPKCSMCRKIKFRPFFRLHKSGSILPGYHASKSVCKKCCSKFNIHSFNDYEYIKRLKMKIELDLNMKKQF
jgi:hypothetical protein